MEVSRNIKTVLLASKDDKLTGNNLRKRKIKMKLDFPEGKRGLLWNLESSLASKV